MVENNSDLKNNTDLSEHERAERERKEQQDAAANAGSDITSDGFLGFIVAIFQMLTGTSGQEKPWWASEAEPENFVSRDSANKTFLERTAKPENYVEMKSTNGFKGSVIEFVMNDLEGGNKLHTDNDGGLTRFGINENHNSVSAKSLTDQQAKDIYADKYWLAEFEKYPPKMQLLAFDTSVNMGPGTSSEMLKESGGDFDKMMELREAKYRALDASGKDKYQGYLDGWLNRLAKVQNYATQIDEIAFHDIAANLPENVKSSGANLTVAANDATLTEIESSGAGQTPQQEKQPSQLSG